MRDSRIGSYGALALMLSTVRCAVAALAALPAGPAPALVASGALSRAGARGAGAAACAGARRDGLAAGLGSDCGRARCACLGLGCALAVVLLPPGPALAAAARLRSAALGVTALARAQIGGFTGDVLGACAVAAECAVLTVLAAWPHEVDGPAIPNGGRGRQQVGRFAAQQGAQQLQRPAMRDDDAVRAGLEQVAARPRATRRDQRRPGLAAGRARTGRVRGPRVERGAGHVVPAPALPLAEIEFLQAAVETGAAATAAASRRHRIAGLLRTRAIPVFASAEASDGRAALARALRPRSSRP